MSPLPRVGVAARYFRRRGTWSAAQEHPGAELGLWIACRQDDDIEDSPTGLGLAIFPDLVGAAECTIGDTTRLKKPVPIWAAALGW
jgi:hypothetical protein